MRYIRIQRTLLYKSWGCLLTIIFASSAIVYAQNKKAALADMYETQALHEMKAGGEATTSTKLKTVVTLNQGPQNLITALESIARQANLKLSYSKQFIPLDKKIVVKKTEATAERALWHVLDDTPFRFGISASGQLVLMRMWEVPSQPQQETVSGTVADGQSGETLPGVNVLIKGTTTGTSTNSEGSFELTVESLQDTLVFSFVGYQTQEVPINGRIQLDITLQTQAIAGEEMVVTAFGLEREQQSLTYSTQKVSTEQLTEARELNVVNSLTGKVAGLSISKGGFGVGSPSKVLLRGNRSFNSSDEPLYVVDGVPVRGDISDLSPDIIEDINVLKGSNAAALYGSAAQNGAIVVTTKRGEAGEVNVSLNNNFMVNVPNILIDFQNQYGQGVNGQYNRRTFSSWGPRMEGQMVQHWSPDPDLASSQIPYSPQPNNVSDFFQSGYNQSTNLTANVGSENTQSLFSYTFSNGQGVVPNNTLQRHNINIRVTSQLSKNLSLDSKLSYMQEEVDYRLSHGLHGATFFAYRIPRNIRTEDASNYEYRDIEGNLRHNTWLPSFDRSYNPYWAANNVRTTVPSERITGLASLSYDLTNNLSFMIRGSYDERNSGSEQRIYNDTGTTNVSGYYAVNESKSNEFNGEFLLSYIRDFDENWNIDVNFGGNIKQQRNKSLSSNTNDGLVVPNFFSISNSLNPQTTYNPGAPVDIWSLYSFAQIGWQNSVFLDISGRNDWSSTLPDDSRSYFYPSVGLSAVVSELVPAFPEVLSFARVRGSWAKVGNSAPAFRTRRYASFLPGGNNGFLALDNVLPASNLKPEDTESYEVGIDIRFFKDRFGLDLTAYKTNTRNQLFLVNLPPASGASQFFANGGNVENKGIEILLNTTPIRNRDLIWDIDLNFASNKNTVLEISDERDLIFIGGPASNFRQFGIEEGEAFGEIYARGFQRDDQGRVLIGSNGLPQVTSGRTIRVANPNPDWTGGITSSITYKNIRASFVIDHRQGGSLVSETATLTLGEGHSEQTLNGRDGGLVFGENLFPDETAVMASDGSPNTTEIDAETFWSSMGGHNNAIGEAFIEDATNTRLRELTLGYSLPQSFLDSLPISNLQITLVGRNLFFIHRASDSVDPDILSGTSKGAPGLESFAPPSVRSFGANLGIDF